MHYTLEYSLPNCTDPEDVIMFHMSRSPSPLPISTSVQTSQGQNHEGQITPAPQGADNFHGPMPSGEHRSINFQCSISATSCGHSRAESNSVVDSMDEESYHEDLEDMMIALRDSIPSLREIPLPKLELRRTNEKSLDTLNNHGVPRTDSLKSISSTLNDITVLKETLKYITQLEEQKAELARQNEALRKNTQLPE